MKTCKFCKTNFEVTDADRAFYKKMEVPEPSLCPACRASRRLAWRSERRLYKRKCSKCNKDVISMYPQEISQPVYCRECWWSDSWNGTDYGRDFDFSRPFFEQFKELAKTAPRLFTFTQGEQVNSDYTNLAASNKNCYLVFSATANEDSYYSIAINYCRDCVDNTNIHRSELLYESINCYDCYHVFFSENCKNCNDSYFLKNCLSCSSCTMCVDLRNKSYCIMNKQYTKEEYEKKIKEMGLDTRTGVEKARKQFEEFTLQFPYKFMFGNKNENVEGDNLDSCKNIKHSFDLDRCEDSAFCEAIADSKDCYDYSYWGRNAELMYEVHGNGFNMYNMRFCSHCWEGGSNMTYCDLCHSCKNLFGCVSMKSAEYCIFNKQYTKEEYENLRARIIEHMKKTGEWGEYFPMDLCLHGYNETVAYDYYPLTREQVEARGGWWRENIGGVYGKETLPAKALPDNIKDVEDSITKEVIACACPGCKTHKDICGKNYKIIAQELSFYKRQNLALPQTCFDCRAERRLARKNPRKLWHRKCAKCSNKFETSYAPERKEIIYCETCYLKEVI